MRNKYLLLLIISLSLSTFLFGCGGGGSSSSTKHNLSSGLKIFVTASHHVGDFKNDPLLPGSNAMEKADSFCNKDANKPNNSIYKALIVDGVNRDAVTLTNWVLQPNTAYFRPYDDIIISQTTSSAIFPVLYQDLTNSVSEQMAPGSDPLTQTNCTWSGISDLSNFSDNSAYDCNGWSAVSSSGTWGLIYEKNIWSISSVNGSMSCTYKASLYCVEQ